MRVSEIEAVVREFAPHELAYEGEEIGVIWGDPDREIGRLGVTWRPTVPLLEECVHRSVDALIIHEPLLQSKKAFVVPEAELVMPPNQQRERLLKESHLVVIRAHSNWDDAEGGNNDSLAAALHVSVDTRIPYGRVGGVNPVPLADFVGTVKNALRCPNVLVVDSRVSLVERVAVVSGSGNALTELIEVAKQKGADVLVSGDIQDSRARFASELGLALIDAGGYYTETPGMKHLALKMRNAVPSIDVIYLDPGPPWRHL